MDKTATCPNCGLDLYYNDRHEFFWGICDECGYNVPLSAALCKAYIEQEKSVKRKKRNEIIFCVSLFAIAVIYGILSNADYFEDSFYSYVPFLLVFYIEWRIIKESIFYDPHGLAFHVILLIQPMLKRDDKGNPVVIADPEK